MKFYGNKLKLTLILCLLCVAGMVQAQSVTLPRASQQATVIQRVGISDITITYHSPGVKGRKVFGGIVPYGRVWRAGANENTTIHFTHDAKIEGKEIKAGTYGLFMLPSENEVQVLFSNFSKSWGTNAPEEKDLALKVSVKPEEIPNQEWLSYDFIERTGNSVKAVLKWEKLQIPFEVSFDVLEIVIANLEAELKGLAGYNDRELASAAQYCVQNNVHLDKAMAWIDRSIASNKNFNNLAIKAQLLAKEGKETEGLTLMEEALPLGNGYQLNRYGYSLLQLNKTKEAIEVFSMNVKKNEGHRFEWGFMDSLGEAYLKDGNKKMALKYYKMAQEKAPENQMAYFKKVITDIENQ